MNKKYLLIIILILFMANGLSACSSVYDEATISPTITLDDINFDPTKVTIPADEEITITLINEGKMDHKWALLTTPIESPFDASDEANIFFAIEVEAGQITTATFYSPAAAGEYEMGCAIPGHPEGDLIGKVIVVQP